MDSTIYTSKVALSLSDLAATPKNPSITSLLSSSSPYNLKTPANNTTNINIKTNSKYEQELQRLMNKHGNNNPTEYDKAMMRKIIGKKVMDGKLEQEYKNVRRVDISRLMESRKEYIKSKHELVSHPDRSERLDDLSKPLERRIHNKENELGKTQKLYKLFNKSINTKTFSPNDFEKWVNNNNEWKQKNEKKLQKSLHDREKSIKSGAKPKITKLSVKLADIANMKQIPEVKSILAIEDNNTDISPALYKLLKGTSEELGITLNVLNSSSPFKRGKPPRSNDKSEQSPRKISDNIQRRRMSSPAALTMNSNIHSNKLSDNVPQRRMSSPRRNINRSMSLSPTRSSQLSVYDRLATRGRMEAEKLRSWTPPPRTDSFSPIISARSDRLAKARRERMTRSQSEERNLSNSRSLIHDSNIQNFSQLSTALSRGRSRSRSFIEPEEKKPNSSTRNLSPSPFKITHCTKPNDSESQCTFKPTLIANETNKIMIKLNSTFEERASKSVEDYLIKKKAVENINKEFGTPGPNHYRSVASTKVALASPTRQISPSPSGKHGFSFIKDTRVLSSSKYEIKKNEQKKENKHINVIN